MGYDNIIGMEGEAIKIIFDLPSPTHVVSLLSFTITSMHHSWSYPEAVNPRISSYAFPAFFEVLFEG